MQVKKVLSIDMDYIMSPCINLYNNTVSSIKVKEPYKFWYEMDKMIEIDKFLDFDKEKFMFIYTLLSQKIKEVGTENILFAEEHDMILELLCGEKYKGDKNDIFEVYNIDHHHDIYYNDNQKQEVERFDFTSLASWVYYLAQNDKLYKYIWLKNDNSCKFDNINDIDFPFDCDNFSQKPIKLNDIEFDYIFVCNSSQYFPHKYRYLFDVLITMANAVKDTNFSIWKTDYCKDGKSRHIRKE